MGRLDKAEDRPLKPKAPCRGCESRHRGCHSQCETYRQFIVANEKFREWMKKQKDIDHTISENAIQNAIAHTQCYAKMGASGGLVKYKNR